MEGDSHFTTWTSRTRVKANAPQEQFTLQTFETLKAVMYKAFARLPEARDVLCNALAEFTRLNSTPHEPVRT